MAATPRKLGQWALDISLSEFGSPFCEGSSTESMGSTSTLQYINSQLVAHGFTTAPGLSLDELSNSEREKVVKCMMGMLSQRVEDMSRAEELSAKFRTLSYDHERLMSMHRTANEKAANAEREMNMHKSRLATANRAVQSAESAHKHTTAELQRTRTALQAIRLTHQSELKRKEKDIERMVDKWSKVCDAQLKLGAAGSGVTRPVHANVAIVEGTEVVGKGQGYLEIALEQTEKARGALAEDNGRLRRLVVSAVNDVQGVLHLARSLLSEQQEELTPFTQTALFPLHPTSVANDKLATLLGSLRESLTSLSHKAADRSVSASPPTTARHNTPHGEVDRLQKIVDALRTEIDEAHKQSAVHAAETQALFDQLHAQQPATREIGDVSVDLMIAPAKDEERDRIEVTKKELAEERRKFTEAAVKLGKEKALLEAERIRFLDEKRSWQVEQMLAELPPTPAPTTIEPASPIRRKASSHPVFRKSSPRKSPRKSPGKPTVVGKAGKAGSSRKTRVSRRSSSGLGLGERLEPSFETEVISPAFPVITVATPSTIVAVPPPLPSSFVPSSFVLPPPSPHSSLPRAPALLSYTESLDLPLVIPLILEPKVSASTKPSDPPPEMPGPSTPPAPRRPFPVAKPFAARMIHAYSPAKPSPLSRILMMNDSPVSPPNPSTSLTDLVEDDEHSPTPAVTFTKPAANLKPALSTLAAELGMEESPLREKKVEPNADKKVVADDKRFTAKEKGKTKMDPLAGPAGAPATARSRPSGAVEKENQVKAKTSRVSSSSSGSIVSGPGSKAKQSVGPPDAKKTVKSIAKPPPVASGSGTAKPGFKPGPVLGGARRVLVQSAEAAKGWRG